MREGRITLWFLKNRHLTACGTAQKSDTQNSKIGHPDHPLAHLYTDTWWNNWMLGTLKRASNVSKIEPWDSTAPQIDLKCVTARKKLAYLIALSSAYLSPKLNIGDSSHRYRNIFDFLKTPIFWKILKRPWSRQKWTNVKNGHNRSWHMSCVQIWQKKSKRKCPKLPIVNCHALRQ